MSQVAIERASVGNRARVAFGTGLLAAVLFFGVAFAFEGVWFIVAPVVGAIGLGFSVAAVRSGEAGRRLAIAGGVLGGIIVVWFLAYVIVDAIS